MAFFSRGIHKTQGSIEANYADETKRGKELEGIIQGIRRDSDQTVRDVKSDEHTSLYDTYSVDFGRSVLRRIRLERFFVDGVETSLSFDMKDHRDMNVLFQNYLSIHTAGSFSFGAMNEYDQYDQIDTLSTRTDYAAAKFNKKIYISRHDYSTR